MDDLFSVEWDAKPESIILMMMMMMILMVVNANQEVIRACHRSRATTPASVVSTINSTSVSAQSTGSEHSANNVSASPTLTSLVRPTCTACRAGYVLCSRFFF